MFAQSLSTKGHQIERIADSGAGRELSSEREFMQQGMSNTRGISPIRFETGNGSYTSDTCVSLKGSTFGQANFSVMEDCPLVRSLGQILASGKPVIWLPNQMPFFGNDEQSVQIAFDESQVHSACRVEDHVPIFSESFKLSDTFAVPAEEVVADEPRSPVPVEEIVEGGSDADSEDANEDPLPRAQRLQAKANTVQHQMCHMPKNPYCDICRRSRMYRRKVARRRHDPLASRGDLEQVDDFGQPLAMDFIIVSKTHQTDRESVVLVVRDVLGIHCSLPLFQEIIRVGVWFSSTTGCCRVYGICLDGVVPRQLT